MAEAELVLGLCRQFHCLPSAVLSEDAYLLRLLAVEEAAGLRDQEPAGADEGWEGVSMGAE